ncbi:MAG: HNH endonuclease domain-containing protein [Candidatus Vecturithrix sp.]|jgi:hypothetical protein|nr:HNH endonuclease domain-containing protein [Candidatus Vecturithrix sp.]
MRNGCKDFRTGDPINMQVYFADRIDIHHIFPQAWCRKQGIGEKRYNSIINKTPLSAKTNQMISSNAPSLYLERIQKNAGIDKERMDAILTSHLIDAAALRTDDFDDFFHLRQTALLDGIEQAMGKLIMREMVTMDFNLLDEQIEHGEDDEQ